MTVENKLSMQEMRKILKEANLLEDNMTTQEVLDIYQMIQESTEESGTSKLIENQKLLIEEMEEDATMVANLKTDEVVENKSPIRNLPDLFLEEVQNEVLRDANQYKFGFNDMPNPTAKSVWKIIPRTCKYIPIQNTEEFLQAGVRERAKIIYSYHSNISKFCTRMARSSFNPAPLPKEINLLEVTDYFSEEIDDETYVSRSGRHTKRKLYYEDESGDKESHKKTKVGVLKKTSMPKLIKKPDDVPFSHEEPAEEKQASSVISPAPTSFKKLTNLEIMSRSSLFNDSPRQIRRPHTTRTESMFDSLRYNKKDKVKSERLTEDLKKFPEKDVIMVDDEEPFKVTGRKPINGRKRIIEPPALDITVKSSPKSNITSGDNASLEQSPSFVSLRRRCLSKNKDPEDFPSKATSSKKFAISSELVCPICSKSFAQSEIEDHAATCDN